MKEGWLCDSILNAAHQPSPRSTTPAFSPGGTMTRSPVVGSRFRWMREDLYEQCSDHITEKIPSSANVGSRPSSVLIRSNSSGVRLCAAMTSGVISLISFLDQLINRGSQLVWVYAAEMFVDHFTFGIVEKSRRQASGPAWIDQIDCRFGIGNIEQVRRHSGFHRVQELRY